MGHKKDHKNKGQKHVEHKHHGPKQREHKRHKHRQREHKHRELEDNEHRNVNGNNPNRRDDGSVPDEQRPEGVRESRTLREIWRKLDKFGRDIKSLLDATHRSGPLPGFPAVQPKARVWTEWDGTQDEQTTPQPGWWTTKAWTTRLTPHWPTNSSPAPTTTSPTAPKTTTSSPVPSTTTPPPASASTTTPAPTTSTTTTTGSSRSRGGVLVVTTQPQVIDGRPSCRRGFTYHAESQMCHELCPTGASFRPHLAACYCDRSDFAISFSFQPWRCAPAGGGGP
ncbi:putative uncharacterized protein DDB_G0271982 [Amphibalanus amphitrite]|uniref:putative uncharacterized protein DDB_G0271982 n=1 Tax=Amphibalanus amphitrite TaxID=1232801 RepID=UPI001C923933|nr:putative uncharacterized protein DDB_G0271982 [Amphibalanus amphitrite]